MREEEFLGTLSLIHAAAVDAAGWDGVLRRLAALTGCVAGGLTQEDPATGQGTPITYFGFDTEHVRRTFAHYLPMNPLFGIGPRMLPGFVVANADVVAPAMFRRSEFYAGWARPQGLCSPVTLVLHRNASRYIPLTLVKPDGRGEATAKDRALLSRLAPHLIQAMQVTLRLRAAEARQTQLTRALDALTEGALLLDGTGRVIYRNGAASAMLDRPTSPVLRVVRGVLSAQDPACDQMLQAGLDRALGRGGPAQAGMVSVRQATGGQVSLTLTPLPGADAWEDAAVDADGNGPPCCMVLMDDGGIALLSRTFRLTPAETRLVDAVAQGKGLSWAARELGISRSTAQSQLDNVFQKTGTNRQAELVALARGGRRPC